MDDITKKVLLIFLVFSLISFITIRIYNSYVMNKVVVHEINSADSNISSSKIDSIISKFKIYLRAEDLQITYGETENYCRVNQMLSKRKKQINIPKWIMPSVGYELDYILASIWFNTKLYQKDSEIRKLNMIIKWIPMFLYIIYFSTMIISFVIYFLNTDAIIAENPSNFLMFIFSKPIFEFICITAYITIMTLVFFSNQLKSKLEEKYEREIFQFVKNECESYKTDISAARVYAREFNKLDFKIFKFNAKTQNLKFFGPFTFF
ncbi:hypothetical protein [Spiroplasma endosymbiont of Diplazon laetatorius]|uniref:hypothetical protein n=1 Tax=Spiroplasma endosymbiont of Diplazon laetatorius TaxID=3066322 RepID=UPI0030D181A5